MIDLAARMAALDLDRRVADRELAAEALLEVAHHVLRVGERTLAHHHVHAERRLIGRQRPDMQVVQAPDVIGGADHLGHLGQVDVVRRALHQQVRVFAFGAGRIVRETVTLLMSCGVPSISRFTVSRTMRHAPNAMSAAMASESSGSMGSQPVSRMTAPAMTTPTDAPMSPATCRNAARMLRFSRWPRRANAT